MLKFTHKIVYHICVLWSYIYTYKLDRFLLEIKYKLNTYWLSRHFAFIAENVILRTKEFKGKKFIKIHQGTTIGRRTIIAAHEYFQNQKFNPTIIIGENVCIGDDSNISCINEIRIGNGVLTGRKILINDNNHGSNSATEFNLRPNSRLLTSKGKITIEDNVWIGEQVIILANVKIGKGSVIAANSVVNHDIPEYCIAAGIPAKVIKKIK